MTVEAIQNDYWDYLRHVFDIFDPIESLEIIFWDWIFERFRLKMGKIQFLAYCAFVEGFTTFLPSIVDKFVGRGRDFPGYNRRAPGQLQDEKIESASVITGAAKIG